MNIPIADLIGYIILVFTGLLPIANPFSTAPLFLALTEKYDAHDRNAIALKAAINMAIVLLAFLLFGALILSFFGITISGLRIAGGLIILVTGMRMLFPDHRSLREDSIQNKHDNIAFTPLAMPMLSGPGSISVVLSMTDKASDASTLTVIVFGYVVIGIGIILTAFVCWLVLRSSTKVTRFLGSSGIDVLTRMMAFFLVAIGVEFILGGLSALEII
ncbi:MAG: MarC family NAAT transporter [Candidatus Thiodiazotropha sp. (ex Lucinoma annulata)]|nr:MarC family NAAT transporter [Candidatus Thiodiazotropha sp. (ex Lucinoma annulata)]